MKQIKKLTFIFIFLLSFSSYSYADVSHFIDFTKVLNTSKPGSVAQKKLQNKFQSETKKFKKIEKDIKDEESKIIAQRKTLPAEEYQKKVSALRKRVSDFQNSKQTSFNAIAKNRNKAKKTLLTKINPIIKKYMEENKIRVVINKQSVILGDSSLEITDQIITIVNKEIPSLKVD